MVFQHENQAANLRVPVGPPNVIYAAIKIIISPPLLRFLERSSETSTAYKEVLISVIRVHLGKEKIEGKLKDFKICNGSLHEKEDNESQKIQKRSSRLASPNLF